MNDLSPRGRPWQHGTERRHSNGTLYLMRCGDFVKIGWSKNTLTTLRDARRFNPFPVSILGTMPGGAWLERELHEQFGAHHIRGEWFTANNALLEFAATMKPFYEARGQRTRRLKERAG